MNNAAEQIKPLHIVDADRWLRGTGLPYWTVAQLREMKVGDVLTLVDFKGPGITRGSLGSVRIAVERKHGFWSFDAIWLLYIGRNAYRRGTIWAPDVRFKLKPGRLLEFIGDADASDSIRLMLRWCRHLAKWAKRAGDGNAYAAILPLSILWPERSNREFDAVEWLSQMLPQCNGWSGQILPER